MMYGWYRELTRHKNYCFTQVAAPTWGRCWNTLLARFNAIRGGMVEDNKIACWSVGQTLGQSIKDRGLITRSVGRTTQDMPLPQTRATAAPSKNMKIPLSIIKNRSGTLHHCIRQTCTNSILTTGFSNWEAGTRTIHFSKHPTRI